MKSKLSLVVLSGLLVFICFSCKKDKIETLGPKSYFPVFPGSYWEYLDSEGDTIVKRTASDCIEDIYCVGGDVVDGPYYVPVYEGVPIWGYSEHTGNPAHSYQSPGLVPVLSLSSSLGQAWEVWFDSGTEVSRKVVFRDSTIHVSGNEYYPTMMVEEFYSIGPWDYIWRYKRYYAEHIGLIKEERLNYDASIYTINLIDYHINY